MSTRLRACFAALGALCLFSALGGAQTQGKLRFVVLGHLRGDKNGELLANLPEVLESVHRESPDLVFLCGDLIYGDVGRAGPGEPTDPAQLLADWQHLDAALADLAVPVYRVPGNHDICDVVARDLWLERYGVLPRAITFGNSRFLLLNSTWWPADSDTRKHPQEALHGVPLGAEQIEFVHAQMQRSSEIENVFIFMHHLLWWEDDASWWKHVAPEFQTHPVRAVFSGDFGPQKFSHLERAGVHYLQTSLENHISTEMLRGRESERLISAQFDNYVVVDVEGTDVRYNVRAVGAMSMGKFSPARYREINEYDKDSYARKLLRRWSTPDRMMVGLAQVAALAFLAGMLSVIAFFVLRRWFSKSAA